MTDKFNALTVVLEKDIREDDADVLMSAIRQLRGVLSVSGEPAGAGEYVAYERARRDIASRLLESLKDSNGA